MNLDKFEEGGAKLEELAAPEIREKAPYAFGATVPLIDAWMFGRLTETLHVGERCASKLTGSTKRRRVSINFSGAIFATGTSSG